MVALLTPECRFDTPARSFSLQDTEGKTWDLQSCCGPKGLLVMFICNHCPYVQAIIKDLVADVIQLKDLGVGSVAVMSNDVMQYPDDDLPHMRAFASEHGFQFPYLYDETQEVAEAYGAICTPDFFGFNEQLLLQYRGRFDASGMKRQEPRLVGELYIAMKQIADTGKGPAIQHPSIGCSLKWRD